MGTIFFLILFPTVVAILLLVLKADAARDIVVKIACAAIAAGHDEAVIGEVQVRAAARAQILYQFLTHYNNAP